MSRRASQRLVRLWQADSLFPSKSNLWFTFTPYKPSDPLSATLITSGNAPTLLSTVNSSLCATSTTTSFWHQKTLLIQPSLVILLQPHAPLANREQTYLHRRPKFSSPFLHRQNIQPSSVSFQQPHYIISTLTLFSYNISGFSSFTPASKSEILKILSNCPNKQSDSDRSCPHLIGFSGNAHLF